MPTLDSFHSDPANWKFGIFYFCRADRRILVPKRIRGLGWTINFARPMAIPSVALVVGAIWGVLALLSFLGAGADVRFTVKVVLAFGVIAFCYYQAHRQPPVSTKESHPADCAP